MGMIFHLCSLRITHFSFVWCSRWTAYGKELVESLIFNTEQLSSDLEKSEGERLAAQQNKATTL